MAIAPARVPFVDLHAHHAPLQDEIAAAIRRVAERGDFILGEDLHAFEQEFAAYCGARHAVGVASGTSALELLLRAHGIGPGHEVIVPASTFYATAYAVVSVGARPVLADCDAGTANLDPEATKQAITAKTRAILVVHLYGRVAEMTDLGEVARRAGVLLLEDACQAHGAIYNGKHAGVLGDGAAFSFYPAKNLGAFGDGGMVLADDEAVASRVRSLRDFGQSAKYRHDTLGTNARLDTLHAAVLRVKLPHLDAWTRGRQAAADRYRQLLGSLPIELPPPAPEGGHVYHLYVVRSPERDRIRGDLARMGIETGMHYPAPIHLLGAFDYLGYEEGTFPRAEAISREGLSLPMFPEITLEQQQLVATALSQSLGVL